MATVKEELDALKLEKEQLEMELLRNQISEIRGKKQAEQVAHETVEKALAKNLQDKKASQDNCNHRHGGTGMAAVQGRGDDSKFALITHRLPLGNIHFRCLRCGKEWDKVLDNQGKVKSYIPSKTEYEWAMNQPTLSTMSESAQFRFEVNA